MVIGGFAGFGDGMYDGAYSAIINRVESIRGEQVGGFIGAYNYKTFYKNRVVSFTNISSYANVYGAQDKKNALFIGTLDGINEAESNYNSFNILNVAVMGHLYSRNNDDEYVKKIV